VRVFADCAGHQVFPRTLTETMDLHEIPAEERRAVFEDMQVMEAEILRIRQEARPPSKFACRAGNSSRSPRRALLSFWISSTTVG